MAPLVMAALAWLSVGPVVAGEPGAAVYRPPYEVVYENGADLALGSRGMAGLKRLHERFPALFSPEIVRKVVLASPDRELGNCVYCPVDPGMIVGDRTVCSEFSRAVVIDPPFLATIDGLYPDFYQPGAEVQAVMFHELMHGWAYAHPDDLTNYARVASDGRLTAFQRKNNRLFRPLWAIERAMAPLRKRVEMGERTREQYAAGGGDDFQRALRDEDWKNIHDAVPLDQAKSQLAKYEARMETLRPKLAERVERFSRRKNTPRRDDRDTHALENEQEWFAYGAEIYFFSQKPEELLTEKERAWWKDLDARLTAR